ncbi:flavin-dependent oxidoreductase [Streptomyces sp. NPDC053048]|uniref:flavin-dependent oxidoreductase n=1 Tax=Streptomyces sp. NPDC053048 TaxID=3365694 RepID=UPI0037CE85F7
MEILVAGAGIGGLTAALSLHNAGFESVRVVEAAPRLRPLGAGVNLLPNAVRELASLGLFGELDSASVQTSQVRYYGRAGGLIWREGRDRAAGYRWPQLSLPRGRLYAVLVDAVRDRLGPDAVTTDARLTGFTASPDGRRVRAHLRHGDGRPGSPVEADVLIGADGLRSAVRATLYPDEGTPSWNGMTVWRGTTAAPPFLGGTSMVVTGDGTQKVVCYPVSQEPDGDGRVQVNWAASRPAKGGPDADRSDWNKPVDPGKFLPHFRGWDLGFLDVTGLLENSSGAFEYPMLDRDPLPRWTFGRVTLLGDAAHAMCPMGSGGTTQAIVDARALAHYLATAGDLTTTGGVEKALTAYEDERRPAMTELQLANRNMGPEIVIDMLYDRAPDGFERASDVLSAAELAGVARRHARIGAFDPDSANAASPYAV